MDEELRAMLEALFAQQDATRVASRQRPQAQMPSRQQMAARERGSVGNFLAEILGGAQEGTMIGSLLPQIERDDFRRIPPAYIASLIGAAALEPLPMGKRKIIQPSVGIFGRMLKKNPEEAVRAVTEMGPQFEQAVINASDADLYKLQDELAELMAGGMGKLNQVELNPMADITWKSLVALNNRITIEQWQRHMVSGKGVQSVDDLMRMMGETGDMADEVEMAEAAVNFLMKNPGGR